MPEFFLPKGPSQPRSAITVTDRIVHTMAQGLGVNWFSTFDPKTYPAPEDDARWQRILDHATFLNINFVRFGQDSQFLTDDQGNFVPGHWSFDQLRRLNAWAEPRGVHIIADSWQLPEPFQFNPWPGAPRAWGADPPSTNWGSRTLMATSTGSWFPTSIHLRRVWAAPRCVGTTTSMNRC